MPLDLTALGPQVRAWRAALQRERDLLGERLARAEAALLAWAPRWTELGWQVAARSPLWPAATPLEPLTTAAPSAPLADYTVLAADGSYLAPDRHGPVYCYLINTGAARLDYGPAPHARLLSEPYLGYRPEDLVVQVGDRPQPVHGHLLDSRRQLSELQLLLTLAGEVADRPAVALLDGTLNLFAAEGRANPFLEAYIAALEAFAEQGLPVAGYISRPRSADVIGCLRAAICPLDRCDGRCQTPTPDPARPCWGLEDFPDRWLFEARLRPGQRSGLWESPWPLARQQYGRSQVCFFYLHVGAEVVRVEVPRWVADQPALVERVQAVILDQCARGQGYPRALIEAHEQAVITAADRQAFERLVEVVLGETGLVLLPSRKAAAKLGRGL